MRSSIGIFPHSVCGFSPTNKKPDPSLPVVSANPQNPFTHVLIELFCLIKSSWVDKK